MHQTVLPGEVHRAGQASGDTVYFATRNKKLVAVRKGRIVYERAMKWSSVTGMGRIGNELVMGTAEGVILVHDMRTGKQTRILSPAKPSSLYGGLVTDGKRIIAAAEDGNIYAFEVDRTKPLWKYRVSSALAALPVAHAGLIYLPLRNGFFVRLDDAGQQQDRLDFQNGAAGVPALNEGFLYVAAGSRLVAFDALASRRWWEVEYEEGSPVHVAAGAKLVVTVTDDGRVHAYPADVRE